LLQRFLQPRSTPSSLRPKGSLGAGGALCFAPSLPRPACKGAGAPYKTVPPGAETFGHFKQG